MAPSFSDGEWKLMQNLWLQSPRTVSELATALAADTGWSKHTLSTMLSRLEERKLVSSRSLAGAIHYAPVYSFEEIAAAEVDCLIERLYQGDAEKLVADLRRRGRLPAGNEFILPKESET